MLAGITTICFAASYTVALIIELARLVWQSGWRRLALFVATGAGLVAQTAYLATRAADAHASPLSSPYDWCLLAAWLLVVVYLLHALYYPKVSTGLFVLPLVLVLIGLAQWASQEPFSPDRAHHFWGNLHGSFLLLGTVAVLVGLLAAVMYLVESYRLKTKLPAGRGFRLPSLEWLERVNNRSLIFSAVFVGIGLSSGLVLNRIGPDGEANAFAFWSNPVVAGLSAVFLWLLAAEAFRLAYPPARRGRKTAYLNLATFVLLAVTLALLLWADSHPGANSQHGSRSSYHESGPADSRLSALRSPPSAGGAR